MPIFTKNKSCFDKKSDPSAGTPRDKLEDFADVKGQKHLFKGQMEPLGQHAYILDTRNLVFFLNLINSVLLLKGV